MSIVSAGYTHLRSNRFFALLLGLNRAFARERNVCGLFSTNGRSSASGSGARLPNIVLIAMIARTRFLPDSRAEVPCGSDRDFVCEFLLSRDDLNASFPGLSEDLIIC
jgi:hypothetical protein